VTRLFIQLLSAFALAASILATAPAAHAQAPASGPSPPRLVTQAIDETRLVPLSGAVHPAANPTNDRGRVDDDLPLPHLLLQLQRAPAQEQALDQLIDQLHDPNSPNFHRWLTADAFGSRFGLAAQDRQTITSWLQQQGFTVNFTYPNGTLIDFSGTAAQVRAAFHTEIHHLSVNGEAHIANMSAPQIPAALAGAVIGIVGLHDFKPQRQYKPRASYTLTNSNGTFYAVTPADLATIYNTNPLFNAGISGQGQTIAVIEDTDVYSTSDWSTFRATFGLSGYAGSFTQMHPAPPSGPNNCSPPGVDPNGDDGEAILDAEWASAAAPSAAIMLASCRNSPDGLLIAVQNLVNGANPPPIISISYGECEAQNTDSASYNAAYQQAVAEGISVFVAAGDWGAAVCDASFNNGVEAQLGIGVNALASTPYNVAVGGTDFADVLAPAFGFGHGDPSAYWNSSSANGPTLGSAMSYVPEIPWNDSCANNFLAIYFFNVYGPGGEGGNGTTAGSGGFCNSAVAQQNNDQFLNIVAGSGGPSAIYAKPSWQSALIGVPSDGRRDLPDVSLFAGNGVWNHFYIFCWSNPSQMANGGGAAPCINPPDPQNGQWSGGGGTSFASPILAAIQALVNQHAGGRQGDPNPVYYALAAAEYGAAGNTSCNSTISGNPSSACVFYDVTQGVNEVPCVGTNDCYRPSGSVGVLSTSDSAEAIAYLATTGWDFATGIGTVNAANLVNQWANGRAQLLTVSVTGNGTVTSTPSGINCGATCSATFSHGQQVTLTATPGTGSVFSGWSGACVGTTSCVVTMNQALSVTATFSPTYTVSLAVTGSGTVDIFPPNINCTSSCSTTVVAGAAVNFEAFPVYQTTGFTGWGGACSGVQNSLCTVVVNGPLNVSAGFAPIYQLAVSETGNGTVTSSPVGITCGGVCFGTFFAGPVRLTANPARGWYFYGWGGACSGTSNCTVTMNGPQTVSAIFATGVGGAGTNPNTWAYRCTNTSFDNLDGALAGTAAWSSTTSGTAQSNGNKGQPLPGDIIEIVNACLGDVTISVDDLTLTNHNDMQSEGVDGFLGQVEFAGATGSMLRNLFVQGPASGGFVRGTSNFTGAEVGIVYAHDGAAVTIQNATINPGPVPGIAVIAEASAAILDTTIAPIDTAYFRDADHGITVGDHSSVTLGLADGSHGVTIADNYNGYGIALSGNSSAEVFGSTISDNQAGQISASVGSAVHISASHLIESEAFEPALVVTGGSSLTLDAVAGGSPTIDVENNMPGAVILAGLSRASLNNATISSRNTQQPTVEAAANSSIILAGGNTITNSAAGGVAIQVDHSSSLIHEPATQLGFAANAPETITGKGNILMQSSVDLGQGPIGNAYGLIWNGPIAVGQNSAIRLQSGVHVTGSVQISAASNGFLNCNNAPGNNCGAAGAANQIDGTIQCIEMVGGPNNPSAHVANPPLARPSAAAADLLGAGFAATSEASNTCLNF
jgi:hypothetical protein